MMSEQHELTRSGRIKRASYKEVCQWVVGSWESVSTSCGTNGFYKAMDDEACIEEVEVEIGESVLTAEPLRYAEDRVAMNFDSNEEFAGF